MDSTVIEEIAKQLGMAIDQAGTFIADNLPAYAGMKAVQAAVPLAIAWGLFLLCVIVALVSLCLAAHERRKCMAEDELPRWHEVHDWDNYTGTVIALFASIFGAFLLVIAVLVTVFCAPDLIGWQSYPEAMLIDMALKAVG